MQGGEGATGKPGPDSMDPKYLGPSGKPLSEKGSLSLVLNREDGFARWHAAEKHFRYGLGAKFKGKPGNAGA